MGATGSTVGEKPKWPSKAHTPGWVQRMVPVGFVGLGKDLAFNVNRDRKTLRCFTLRFQSLTLAAVWRVAWSRTRVEGRSLVKMLS